jgi:hypothetical protein
LYDWIGDVVDPESLKWIGPLGVGGVLAYVVIRFYHESSKQWLSERKEMANQYAGLFAELLGITKETVRVITESTLVLHSLHARVDQLDMLRVVRDEEGQPVDLKHRTGPVDTAGIGR